jgi:hypothetical protein
LNRHTGRFKLIALRGQQQRVQQRLGRDSVFLSCHLNCAAIATNVPQRLFSGLDTPAVLAF